MKKITPGIYKTVSGTRVIIFATCHEPFANKVVGLIEGDGAQWKPDVETWVAGLFFNDGRSSVLDLVERVEDETL